MRLNLNYEKHCGIFRERDHHHYRKKEFGLKVWLNYRFNFRLLFKRILPNFFGDKLFMNTVSKLAAQIHYLAICRMILY